MKVLYLTDDEPDYLADQMYDGLCTLLGRQQVMAFPGKPAYHIAESPMCAALQSAVPDRDIETIGSLLRDRQMDLVIVSSPRRGAIEALNRMAALAPLPPLVLLDGEDDGTVRADLAERLGAGLYFKRELKAAGTTNGGRWRIGRSPVQGRLDGRVHPLPFSVTPDMLSPVSADSRDVDISFLGRASHRKRVRAVNLLRRTAGIRFEGGLYLAPSDRRSKLAESWLGIVAAKLVGDPQAPVSAQHSKLDADHYKALLRRSKMGLSIRGGGFDTVRYWEIVATRTLLVSEPPDIVIPHNFEHGRHVMFCRHDLRDLPTIVRRLRDDEATRHRMVEAAYQHLLAYHTSERRAAYLLDLCRTRL